MRGKYELLFVDSHQSLQCLKFHVDLDFKCAYSILCSPFLPHTSDICACYLYAASSPALRGWKSSEAYIMSHQGSVERLIFLLKRASQATSPAVSAAATPKTPYCRTGLSLMIHSFSFSGPDQLPRTPRRDPTQLEWPSTLTTQNASPQLQPQSNMIHLTVRFTYQHWKVYGAVDCFKSA